MLTPKISVIVPVYNAENYLRQCMDSICGQTLREIEIICVNDGSTDNSLAILEDYKMKDDRINIITQKNGGTGCARNTGICSAKGKYLSFLDADDFFDLDMLYLAYEHIEKCEADIVWFDVFGYDNKTGSISSPGSYLIEKYIPPMDVFFWEDIPEYIFNIVVTSVWNKLYKRELIESSSLRFPLLGRAEDVYFAIIANFKAMRICVLRKRLLYYRMNNLLARHSGINEFPFSSYDSLMCVKNHLEKDKIFCKVKQSFFNYFIESMLYDLNHISDLEVFEMMYQKLQTDYMISLELDNLESYYFYDEELYRKYKLFMMNKSKEYVFKKLKMIEENSFFYLKKFAFPYDSIKQDSRIILYGAGDVGRAYFYTLLEDSYCKVVLWVDRNYEHMGNMISNPQEILSVEYDYIVLAAKEEKLVESMRKSLMDIGIDMCNVIWLNKED